MSKITTPAGARPQERHDRLLQEWEHDPYHSKLKLVEATVCSGCGAVYHHGRWQWVETSGTAHRALCPACHRIEDKVPAGFLTIAGGFAAEHREEITNLIRHVEQREKAEHPLKRIMDIESQPDGMLITFTDPHLARAAGVALRDAYQGELAIDYSAEAFMLRVSWRR